MHTPYSRYDQSAVFPSFLDFPAIFRPIPSRESFDVCQTLLKFSKIQESFYVTI